MMMSRRFELFVSAYYGDQPSVSEGAGRVQKLDVFTDTDRRLFRSKLPDFNHVTFRFPQTSVGEQVQNFYHMDDYMIVSKPILDAFSSLFRQSLESAPIRILHEDGSSASEQYFAARINKVIDCIDPERSTWTPRYSREKPDDKFSAGMFTSVLEPKLQHEFANGGGGKYISYPTVESSAIKSVKLVEDRIPLGTALFQPMYWPGHWIIEADFARNLERMCAGGTRGYYFWTLDLGDIGASLGKLMHDLR